MRRPNDLRHAMAFSTRLGWMALLGTDDSLEQLVFGHPSAASALAALDAERVAEARLGRWNAPLVARLKAYASGTADDFLDVAIDLGAMTAFQRAVVAACRRIPPGETLSYGQLAARAGAPGAARAVGSVMRRNRLPLIVPCHRVVGACGLGGYSAVDGLATKQRLLALEGAARGAKRGKARRPRAAAAD